MDPSDETRLQPYADLLRKAVHALNSPLGAVLMNVELAIQYIHLDRASDALRALEKVKSSTELCARMLRDGLQIAMDDPATWDSPLTVPELANALQSRAGDKLKLRVEGHPPDMHVPSFVARMVFPLLTNAMEHGAKEFILDCSDVEGQIEFHVEDDGQGVPEPLRSKLFEPFFTSKNNTHPGLGLYRVKRMVEAAGGSIKVVDGRHGDAFKLSIALPGTSRGYSSQADVRKAQGLATGALATGAGQVEQRQLGILLVEDQETLRKTIRDALRCCGYRVLGPAATLDEANRLMDRDKPDAALVDFHLRNCTAEALMHRLAGENVPFAILTGQDPQALPKQWRDHPLISKPCGLNDLKKALASLLKGDPSEASR